MKMDKPTVIDLFCGCGGLSLGAARAGFSVIAAVDNDPHAIAAHKKNFPNSLHIDENIEDLSGADILGRLETPANAIDGVIGGPPCQGFSNIGRGDQADPRNRLFDRFFRLVDELQPRFFLCENVPGILNEKYKQRRNRAFNQVRDSYDLLPAMKLRASDYGAPTTRTRVLFVGVRKDASISLDVSHFEPEDNVQAIKVKHALKGLPKRIKAEWQAPEQGWRTVGNGTNGEFGKRIANSIPAGVGDREAVRILTKQRRVSGCLGTAHTDVVVRRFRKVAPGKTDNVSRTVRLDPNGFCPTLRAGTGSDRGSHQALRPIHPTEDRMITVREAARLQGFPDWFQFDDTKWHSFRQIGNSVSPILAERILAAMNKVIGLDTMEKSDARTQDRS